MNHFLSITGWLLLATLLLAALLPVLIFKLVRKQNPVSGAINNLPRMTNWLLIALALSALIFALHPQQLGVSLYKLNLIALAGVAGYWLDRGLFPYARPDTFMEREVETETEAEDGPLAFELDHILQNDLLLAASMLRRAVIVSAAMIAVGLGA